MGPCILMPGYLSTEMGNIEQPCCLEIWKKREWGRDGKYRATLWPGNLQKKGSAPICYPLWWALPPSLCWVIIQISHHHLSTLARQFLPRIRQQFLQKTGNFSLKITIKEVLRRMGINHHQPFFNFWWFLQHQEGFRTFPSFTFIPKPPVQTGAEVGLCDYHVGSDRSDVRLGQRQCQDCSGTWAKVTQNGQVPTGRVFNQQKTGRWFFEGRTGGIHSRNLT